MNIDFSTLISLIDINLLKSIIKKGLASNNENFKNIRKNLPKNLVIPGFRKVCEVSFSNQGRLFEPIFKYECYTMPQIARQLIQIWFIKNDKLKILVESDLIKFNYKTKDPGFSKDEISVVNAKDEHVIIVHKQKVFKVSEETAVKAGNEEYSLMATLLGVTVFDVKENPCEAEHHSKPENIWRKEIELLNELEPIFKTTGNSFISIGNDLLSGTLPDIDGAVELFDKLEQAFLTVREAINADLDITSISELVNCLENKIEEGKRSEIDSVLHQLKRLEKVQVIKKGNPDFLGDLKSYFKDLKEEILGSESDNEEVIREIKNENHLVNYFVKAIDISSCPESDFEELDRIIEKIRSHPDSEQLKLINPFITHINRSQLIIPDNDEVIDAKWGEEKHQKECPVGESKPKESEDYPIKTETCSSPEENKQEKIEKNNSPEEKENHDQDTSKDCVDEIVESIGSKPNDEPDVQNTPEDSDININEEIISPDDDNILGLLLQGNYGLAYHLAKWYEKNNTQIFIPSIVIRNFIIGLELRNPNSEIAEDIQSNLVYYDLGEPNTISLNEYNLILVSTILRPALIAGHVTGAAGILNTIHVDEFPELSALKMMIFDFIRQQGKSIEYRYLRTRADSLKFSELKDEAIQRIYDWYDSAPNLKFRNKNDVFSKAWYNWFQKNGYVTIILSSFLDNPNRKNISTIIESLGETEWKKVLFSDFEKKFSLKKSRGSFSNN